MITNELLSNWLKWRDISDKRGGGEMPSVSKMYGGEADAVLQA